MGPSTTSMPDSLEGRYAQVCERISRAAARSGRARDDVLLVAVTKTAEPEQIRAMMDLGHKDFGENRVQQLIQRAAMVDEYLARLRVHAQARRRRDDAGESLFEGRSRVDLGPAVRGPAVPGATANATHPIRWHMIGHLQRNKAKKVVDIVRLIHSVDSLRLAEELQGIAVRTDQVVEVLVEVNCSGEESKHGCPVPAAIPLAEQIETMVNVRVRGLMTMAPLSTNPDDARRTFARCRELFLEMKGLGLADGKFNILSMGMSSDFEVAIEEGANIVRVGSAIFGESKNLQPVEDDEDD